MKKIQIMLICSIFACNNKSDTSSQNVLVTENGETVVEQDTFSWIEDFKEFRNAIYNNDISKVKSFIEFKNPKIKGDIIHQGLIFESGSVCFSFEEDITERDFTKFYSRLFPKPFTQTILKIKSEQLHKTGNSESLMIKIDDISYKMYATFDKNTNQLDLNLYSEKMVNEDSDNQIKSEFSIIYTFSIRNKRIQLTKIDCAG